MKEIVNRLAPDFVLPRLGGGRVGLSDLRGKVVVLNFWATWCPHCIEELPSLESGAVRSTSGGRGVRSQAASSRSGSAKGQTERRRTSV